MSNVKQEEPKDWISECLLFDVVRVMLIFVYVIVEYVQSNRHKRRRKSKIEVDNRLSALEALYLRQQQKIEEQQQAILQMQKERKSIRSLLMHLGCRLNLIGEQIEHFQKDVEKYLEE